MENTQTNNTKQPLKAL